MATASRSKIESDKTINAKLSSTNAVSVAKNNLPLLNANSTKPIGHDTTRTKQPQMNHCNSGTAGRNSVV